MLRALRGRAAHILLDRGGALALAVAALYIWLAPTHVVDGDNAEFATLGALGGAAHPPGYPLYVLYLRAMSWLPGESPAHTAAIATALLGAASIAMLHAACRAWGARPLAATLACALFAGSPIVMVMYSEAEVFALNGLVVATVLWLAANGGPLRGIARAAALGLVAGLGLADHHTCVLLAPVGVLGVVRGARESGRPALAPAGAVVGLAIGLLPYAYELIAPVHEASWGSIHGVGDVVNMFLRRDFGGPGTFATKGAAVPATANLASLAASLGRAWLWLPALAGLGSAIDRIARARGADPVESRWAWLTWLASFALAGPLLALRFNVASAGVGAYVVHRFHILPCLLLAIPVADAIGRVIDRAKAVPRRLADVAALAGFASVAGWSLPHVQRVHVPAVAYEATNTLRSLPAGAVILGYDDDLAFGIYYAQLVRGERTDVTYVQVPLLSLPWYRARVTAEGLALDGLVDDALARHRPVFAESYAHSVLDTHPSYPYGLLVRVLARGDRAPPPAEVAAIDRDVYDHFELPYTLPSIDDEIPAAIHERYAGTWLAIARVLDDRGLPDQAEQARAYANAIGPKP